MHICKLIIYSHIKPLDCVSDFLVARYWPYLKLQFTGAMMETTDSAMKRTMVVLMTTLFAMFLGIIYLANYVS